MTMIEMFLSMLMPLFPIYFPPPPSVLIYFSVCIFPYVSSQYSAGTLTPWALANLWTTCDASKSTTASPSPLASCSRTWPRPTRSFTTKSDDAIYLLNMAQAAAAIYNAIAAMAAILEICFKFSVDRP